MVGGCVAVVAGCNDLTSGGSGGCIDSFHGTGPEDWVDAHSWTRQSSCVFWVNEIVQRNETRRSVEVGIPDRGEGRRR